MGMGSRGWGWPLVGATSRMETAVGPGIWPVLATGIGLTTPHGAMTPHGGNRRYRWILCD